MATAISPVFDISIEAVVITQVTAEDILETSATHSVYGNSNAGSIHIAIKTTGPYDEGSTSDIVDGNGAVWNSTKAVESGNVTQFTSSSLRPGETHYIGVVQEYSAYNYSTPFTTTSFSTPSYPQTGTLPYQVSDYPDRYNYRNVPLYADLRYGWGGEQPLSFEANQLPPGLLMSSEGIISSTPSAIGTTGGIVVTATNALGSKDSVSFSWVIDRLPTEPTVPPEPEPDDKYARKRSELFEATRQYAERDDIDVEAMLPTMLTRANALLTRELRARNMSDRHSPAIVDGQNQYAIPDDYELLENLKIVYEGGSTVTPQFVTSEQANNRQQSEACYFTIENNSFRFSPALNGPGIIDVTYFKVIPYMSDDDSGNWLLDRWFDVYHNAMMVEVSAFVKDTDQLASWKALLDESLESAKTRTQKDMWTQPGLQIRLEH